MATQQLQDVLDRLRGLDPDEIRSRLLEIEAEEKALRIIMRTARAARSVPPKKKEVSP